MNLINFLKQTDALTAQYSAEQLIAFIHDIGRFYPEHRREDFLERLKSAGNKANKSKDVEFNEMHSHIMDNLERINSREVTVTEKLSKEYDWRDESVGEFYYEDNSGISAMLEDAFDFVHICMDMGRYQEGLEVGIQMLLIEILCDSEYGDVEFSLEDMVYYKLLDCDLKQVILDTVYCAYHAAPPAERPETL